VSEYNGDERRREVYVKQETLLERWLTPSALAFVFGGVVWGVQLNFAVKQLTSEVAQADTVAHRSEQRVDRLAENILKASVILERIEKRIDKLEAEHENLGVSARK